MRIPVGTTWDAKHAALQQIGWLGHNNERFYTLDQQESCKLNNKGGYSPVYQQIGTFKFDDEREVWYLDD